jgi:PPOX class F420-dependent enzyme/OxyR family protein
VFTEGEIGYLTSQRLGRLATVDERGAPHVVPVGFRYNAGLSSIDIIGRGLATSRKYRHIQRCNRVAFVVDDIESVDPWLARGIEIRGTADALASGGHEINPNAGDEMLRIIPERIIAWGIDAHWQAGTHARDVPAAGGARADDMEARTS